MSNIIVFNKCIRVVILCTLVIPHLMMDGRHDIDGCVSAGWVGPTLWMEAQQQAE